jgi:hypothetical protein
MKWKRQVKEGFWDMEFVCVPFSRWMGKTKDLSTFELGMVYNGEPGAPVCVKNCKTAVFFMLNSFLCVWSMVHPPKDIQPTSHNCGKYWSQHGPAFLWNAFATLYSPCPKELRLFWEKRGEGVFLMFGILCHCTFSLDTLGISSVSLA